MLCGLARFKGFAKGAIITNADFPSFDNLQTFNIDFMDHYFFDTEQCQVFYHLVY